MLFLHAVHVRLSCGEQIDIARCLTSRILCSSTHFGQGKGDTPVATFKSLLWLSQRLSASPIQIRRPFRVLSCSCRLVLRILALDQLTLSKCAMRLHRRFLDTIPYLKFCTKNTLSSRLLLTPPRATEAELTTLEDCRTSTLACFDHKELSPWPFSLNPALRKRQSDVMSFPRYQRTTCPSPPIG